MFLLVLVFMSMFYKLSLGDGWLVDKSAFLVDHQLTKRTSILGIEPVKLGQLSLT
jgi:hypothetical protein